MQVQLSHVLQAGALPARTSTDLEADSGGQAEGGGAEAGLLRHLRHLHLRLSGRAKA